MALTSPLTLTIVKNELGITDGTYDSEITERLPFAEAKFRQVAGSQFRQVLCVFYDSGSPLMKVYQGPDSQINYINYGDIIISEDFPSGTYVIENYRQPSYNESIDENGIVYELRLSGNATVDSSTAGSDAILSYNISHYAVLSQIVWYMIQEMSIAKVGESSIQSKRIGPVSINYGSGDINQRFGLPNKIVQQIPKYQSMY